MEYAAFLFCAVHFYFLTSFEVCFYLYYILPYETRLLANLFDAPHGSELASYNVTVSNDYESKYCAGNGDRFTEANAPLFTYCFAYLGVMQAMMATMVVYDMHKTPLIAMSPSAASFASLEDALPQVPPTQPCFLARWAAASELVVELKRSLYFIAAVAVFEYLFFSRIVDQMKVMDLRMVVCNLLRPLK
jgi:hypothetical protein